jgi:hypothetical protein
MGILDEAIREHLELKRQHGASETEVKDLEDEAFGPPSRPDELEAASSEASAMPMAEPESAPAPPSEPSTSEPAAETEPRPPSPESVSPPPEAAEPAVDEPAQTPVPEPAPAAEESGAGEPIADQPTELYDVEGELPQDAGAGLEEAELDGEEEEFFSEQSLSDELDSALGEPQLEPSSPPAPEAEPEPEEEAEPESESGSPSGAAAPETEEQPAEPDGGPFDQDKESEDVLEETPEFLQDTPEHDRLWFEQKPPKDFDFDE